MSGIEDANLHPTQDNEEIEGGEMEGIDFDKLDHELRNSFWEMLGTTPPYDDPNTAAPTDADLAVLKQWNRAPDSVEKKTVALMIGSLHSSAAWRLAMSKIISK